MITIEEYVDGLELQIRELETTNAKLANSELLDAYQALQEAYAAERAISDKLEKALKTICANTVDAMPPYRGLGVSGPVKSIASATLAELAAMRKGETE